MKKIILILLFFIITPTYAYYNPGAPVGFINDFAGVIDDDYQQRIEEKLQLFRQETSNEIVVVTIDGLQDDYIENFAVELFKDWGIGTKEKNNGVLLLVAVNDRQMRIEVGYGLEGALTDAQSSWIINNTLKPAFQEQNYGGGIDQAIDKIISAIKGEYILPTEETKNNHLQNYQAIVGFIIFIFMWLVAILGRSKSWWAGGVIGGVIGVFIIFIWGLFWIGLTALILLVPFGLIFDYIVSKQYKAALAAGRNAPWWIGGGRGGSTGGFGGFGGFGGGFSGGGGNSGSW